MKYELFSRSIKDAKRLETFISGNTLENLSIQVSISFEYLTTLGLTFLDLYKELSKFFVFWLRFDLVKTIFKPFNLLLNLFQLTDFLLIKSTMLTHKVFNIPVSIH